MTGGPVRRLLWRVADALDYHVTLLRLRILDRLAGPLPETPADLQRKRDREGFPSGRAVRSRAPSPACWDRQPSTRLIGTATPEKDNHEPAAERSKRRTRKLPERRMPARRKVTDIL
jgi:hypothetical protein